MTNIVVAVGLMVTTFQTNELLVIPNTVQMDQDETDHHTVRKVKMVPVLSEYTLISEIKVITVTNITKHRLILGTNGPITWRVQTNTLPPTPGEMNKQ